jgi:hypothetical protein
MHHILYGIFIYLGLAFLWKYVGPKFKSPS